jgi:hypothetical protein
MSSKDREVASRRKYTIDELENAYKIAPNSQFTAVVTEELHTEGAALSAPPAGGAAVWRYANKDGSTIVRNGGPIPIAAVKKLKDAGVKEINAFEPGYWDLVCEELCGQGHSTMQGRVIIVDNDEYVKQFETPKPKAGVALNDK